MICHSCFFFVLFSWGGLSLPDCRGFGGGEGAGFVCAFFNGFYLFAWVFLFIQLVFFEGGFACLVVCLLQVA